MGLRQLTKPGYWVPFEAAKAVAAKFCWHIRYVLVPVFGPDFISMCTRPEDSGFLNLCVGHSIIQHCTDRATIMHTQSRKSSRFASPQIPSAFVDLPVWPPKPIRPKPEKALDEESGYGTDSDRSDNYPGSPYSTISSGWTPVNTPVLKALEQFSFPRAKVTSSAKFSVTSNPNLRHEKKQAKISTKRTLLEGNLDSEEGAAVNSSSACGSLTPKRRKISGAMTTEMAAGVLLELNVADATLNEHKMFRRRRASA